jgi:hypothetical protein
MTNRTTVEIEKSTLQDLKQVGHKNQTYSQLIAERITCDAADCEGIGTNEIKINAGKFGTISLFVCTSCIGKFQD